VLLVLAGAKLLMHGLCLGNYGYFRDELYFLDCARHLQWGYVDDTPGIVGVFKLALMLGGSLQVVRLLAALCGVATVITAPLMARELGGGRRAQAFAGVCVLAAPIYMSMHGILCVGDLEPLAWIGCSLILARIARTGDSRLWLAFGVVAGLGIEIKYTMLLVLACFLGALVLTRLRKEMLRPHFWAGAALALLIAAPTLIWQVRNHFPLLTDMENIRTTGKNVVLGPWPFLKQQILFMNPLLLPVVAGGVAWLFTRREARVLGWFYGILLGAMFAVHAKDYYVAAVYPLLYAAGAVALEGLLEGRSRPRGRAWPWIAVAAPACCLILLEAPILLPVLSPERHVAYQERLGGKGQKAERGHSGPMDQVLGDQFGWRELAAETAAVYQGLSPEDRAVTGIYAGNYGEAGAINQFGPALGLPAAICAHQAHSFWGPPPVEPKILICLGCGREGLEKVFDSVTVASEHHSPWGMGEENRPIYLCRGPHGTFRGMWPRITHWN
jgi:hypothetical protein